ncbi:MAG: PAS domain-containing sensor histidine kinase, partial [Methylocystis sp.]|nr:PAS domain-containing sensor histidine kinase [Methylocystis sp.]
MATLQDQPADAPKERAKLSLRLWFGPIAVIGAVACALATFFVMAELGPIALTSDAFLMLVLADAVALVLLIGLVLVKGGALLSAWRRGEAAARLHIRIVGIFSVIALAPAIILAVVGWLTFERALNLGFMADVKGFVHQTAEAARLFRETQCRSLLQDAQLSASDLDRARVMFNADRSLFHEFFTSRARFLGFSVAALVKSNGEVIDRVDVAKNAAAIIIAPPQSDFEDAKKAEPLCLVIDEGKSFVALRTLHSFEDTFLYATRAIDPFAVEFPQQAAHLIANYDAFDAYRGA